MLQCDHSLRPHGSNLYVHLVPPPPPPWAGRSLAIYVFRCPWCSGTVCGRLEARTLTTERKITHT